MNESQTTLDFGRRVNLKPRLIAAQAAADAADRRNSGWSDDAYAAFVAFAKIDPSRRFTTEDARRAAKNVPDAPDCRAWGAVAVRAKREGIVISTGYALAQYGDPKTLWKLNPAKL